jgi:hypothetical protein
MPRLGNILSDSDEIAIATPDGDIHIQYYPSRVSQKTSNQFRSFVRTARSESATDEEYQESLQKIYAALLNVIKSWDLDDEVPCGKCEICRGNEGKEDEEKEECQSKKIVMFPLDAEHLDTLPGWLLGDIVQGIIVSPNRKAPQKKKN